MATESPGCEKANNAARSHMFPESEVTRAKSHPKALFARSSVFLIILAAYSTPPYQYEWYLPARSLARASFALVVRTFSDAMRLIP